MYIYLIGTFLSSVPVSHLCPFVVYACPCYTSYWFNLICYRLNHYNHCASVIVAVCKFVLKCIYTCICLERLLFKNKTYISRNWYLPSWSYGNGDFAGVADAPPQASTPHSSQTGCGFCWRSIQWRTRLSSLDPDSKLRRFLLKLDLWLCTSPRLKPQFLT